MLDCHKVAEYFLSLADEDAGDLISNLKLQKLVYYAQGFHLALFDEPMFDESIEAWVHGPVVPKLYHSYKEYGCGPIPKPEKIDCDAYSKKQKELLNDVYAVYGQFSAWKLRNMTHEESPWKDADRNQTIKKKAIKKFFKEELIEKDE